MRLCSDGGDFIELERPESGDDAGDILLLARVHFHGFAAKVNAWVQPAAWLGFTQDLVNLEKRRQGGAKLESVSPRELSILVRSIDHAGHLGVEGTVGSGGHAYSASLHFSVLVFDPSQLPAFVRAARVIANRLRTS